MKLALVYDRVNKFGGAERVLQALHEIWPDAPLYTSVYDSHEADWAKNLKVLPSFLQKIPFVKNRHELIFWLMPFAFESFDFSQYDVVISVTSEYAKGIITKPETKHICYCLTPTRYLWSGQVNYISGSLLRWLSKPIINRFQDYDRMIGQRPDNMIAISQTVQDRIKKYYGRESKVIYPPVDTEKFKVQSAKFKVKEDSNFYLVVSRLVKYKRVDLVVKTFNELGWNLVITGTGAEEQRLKHMARPNIKFHGQLADQELIGYYQNCQAVIFPTEEDFGIVPLEVQACGKPVIAYRKGGATETVVEGETGEFFNRQTTESLKSAILKFKPEIYQPTACRNQAEKFSKEKFKKEFKNTIDLLYTVHQSLTTKI